jgi:hypothetical protein
MGRRSAAIACLCVLIAASFIVGVSAVPAVTDQDLLREAVRERGALDQIFEQQAAQGYYADALETARLYASRLPLPQWALSGLASQLIEIRAENGDTEGAKDMAKRIRPTLGGFADETTRVIAKIQVDRGDLAGALETCPGPEGANFVMEEYGLRQIAAGDFAEALKISQQVNERSAYDLFYDVGSALRERGEQSRLHDLAAQMDDRARAAQFEEAARFTLWPHIAVVRAINDSCAIAWVAARDGKFADAFRFAERSNCRYSDLAIQEFACDPAQAERDLRGSPDTQDVRRGLEAMSEAAARKGDVENALRLLDAGEQIGGQRESCLNCRRMIAWAWTLKGDPKKVLHWARSLPHGNSRAYALLGMAQALAHHTRNSSMPSGIFPAGNCNN